MIFKSSAPKGSSHFILLLSLSLICIKFGLRHKLKSILISTQTMTSYDSPVEGVSRHHEDLPPPRTTKARSSSVREADVTGDEPEPMKILQDFLQAFIVATCCNTYLYTLLLCRTLYYYVYNDRHVRVTLLEYIYIFILVYTLVAMFIFIFMTVQDVSLEDVYFIYSNSEN